MRDLLLRGAILDAHAPHRRLVTGIGITRRTGALVELTLKKEQSLGVGVAIVRVGGEDLGHQAEDRIRWRLCQRAAHEEQQRQAKKTEFHPHGSLHPPRSKYSNHGA